MTPLARAFPLLSQSLRRRAHHQRRCLCQGVVHAIVEARRAQPRISLYDIPSLVHTTSKKNKTSRLVTRAHHDPPRPPDSILSPEYFRHRWASLRA
ncbi:hypothetical protein BV22DRAFT_939183 [Leucogyrophana mollusca]|uniref:Uncharacterized protein n=1 Tax=Leucogyrophana mollusca TaxID=85980 RepID=A0ACB8AVL8_9AGAM|nr:hypothetical protein BV22DRAFT_939183 [Leucogyrophana mollusca]